MKKLSKILICLLLCVFSFGLFGCNESNDSNLQTIPDVEGNGGMVVSKDNYIYFVNGYNTASSMTEVNAQYKIGSLMVAKLDNNGQIVYNNDGSIEDDYLSTISSKLCGFEATNLFLAGDYLYFTSPCQENYYNETSREEEWAKDRVDINRVKLDNTSSVEKLYTSGVSNANFQMKMYTNKNECYFLVYEKGANLDDSAKNNVLYRLNAQDKSVAEVKSGVSSIVFAEDSNSVFFTTSENDLFILNQYNTINGKSEVYASNSLEMTVKAVEGGYVYISMNHSSSNTNKDLKISQISKKSAFSLVCATSKYSDKVFVTDDAYVVGVSGSDIELYIGTSNDPILVARDTDATSIDVIGFTNGCVVYRDNNKKVKIVSYANAINEQKAQTPETITTLDSDNNEKFEIDDGYLYFYKKVNQNQYLYRINLTNNHGDEAKLVGVYLSSDVPTEK